MSRTVPVPEPADNYNQLRKETFAISWRKKKFAPTAKNPHVWGVLMEVGYPKAVVTLVCLIDGTTNLYFGTGGGIIGGGNYESIRMKSEEFILASETFLKKLNKTKNYPLPGVDRVRFYVMTFSGVYTTQDNVNIASETHELYPLFRSGHEVIAAMRVIDESGVESAS